jgi:CBS domain containing-hemolysin-like protein
MGAILLVTLIAVIGSFLCSLMEAAFYSITPSKVEELRKAGNKGGIRLAKMRENVDVPISAILTLNTIANSAGAAFAGFLVGNAYGNAAVGIYSALFTLVILIASEIVPKTLGVTYADRVAPVIAGPLQVIIFVLRPVIAVTQTVTRVLRRGHEGANAPSEQEILAQAEMGARMGTLLPDEARWAINALKLDDVLARDLMTPRTVVYMLPAALPLSEVKHHSQHWTFSRLPVVANNNPDEVVGLVYRREVFDQLVGHTPEELASRTLADVMHPAIFVPETVRCNELLKRFLKERQHLIIVTNEYGGMEGVITLEDVLEFLLGEEIVDQLDKHVDMQEVARRLAKRRMEHTHRGRVAPVETRGTALSREADAPPPDA